MLAVAIRYALSRWEALVRFIVDGRIDIDSNAVERAMRPIALRPKNYLFAARTRGPSVGLTLRWQPAQQHLRNIVQIIETIEVQFMPDGRFNWYNEILCLVVQPERRKVAPG